jgi:hypothetical protein
MPSPLWIPVFYYLNTSTWPLEVTDFLVMQHFNLSISSSFSVSNISLKKLSADMCRWCPFVEVTYLWRLPSWGKWRAVWTSGGACSVHLWCSPRTDFYSLPWPNGTLQFYEGNINFLLKISFHCFFYDLFLICLYILAIFLLPPY